MQSDADDRDLQEKILLVDGANGYLGLHVVAEARNQGYGVIAVVRAGTSKSQNGQASIIQLQNLGAEIVEADLEDSCMAGHFARADWALHLIGSIAPGKGQSFDRLHQDKARVFADLAKNNIQRLRAGLVTALGADLSSPSAYLSSKCRSEATFADVLPADSYFVFRPSLIIGRYHGRRDSKLVRRYIDMVRSRPRVPLINGGKNLIQPVDVQDLARAIIKAFASQCSGVLEIGGPEVMPMRVFIERLMQQLNCTKPVVALPAPLARGLASILEMVQDVPLISKDQAYLATTDNICKNNRLDSLLNGEPSTVGKSLATYGDGA